MGLFVYGLQSQQIKIPVQQSLLHIISSTFPPETYPESVATFSKRTLHFQTVVSKKKKKPAHCENSINLGLTSLHYIGHFGILFHR